MVKFRRSIVKFSDEVVEIRVKSSDSGESRQIHSKVVKTRDAIGIVFRDGGEQTFTSGLPCQHSPWVFGE